MTLRGRGLLPALALLPVLLIADVSAARAQGYDTSIAWGGGYMKFAPFVDQGAAAPSDIGIAGTWVALLQAETWKLNRWVGIRAGGFYSNGAVEYPTAEKNVSAYGGELAALLRVLPPRENQQFSLYLIGGGGLMWFGLGESDASPVVPIAGTSVVYDARDRRQFMVMGGGGLEVLSGITAFEGQLGVRVEVVDQVALSRPLRVIDGGDPDMMHNLRFSLTLFSGVPKLF
jgi:hypothetical protein